MPTTKHNTLSYFLLSILTQTKALEFFKQIIQETFKSKLGKKQEFHD